jgi:hypothetical protein
MSFPEHQIHSLDTPWMKPLFSRKIIVLVV